MADRPAPLLLRVLALTRLYDDVHYARTLDAGAGFVKCIIPDSFVPALPTAKIEGARSHDLRHTFASPLVMAGVDLRTVQDLLGHKTLAMTLWYSRLSPAHQLDAVQRLNRPANCQRYGHQR